MIVNASERLWLFDDRLELIPYLVAKSTANLLRFLIEVSVYRAEVDPSILSPSLRTRGRDPSTEVQVLSARAIRLLVICWTLRSGPWGRDQWDQGSM